MPFDITPWVRTNHVFFADSDKKPYYVAALKWIGGFTVVTLATPFIGPTSAQAECSFVTEIDLPDDVPVEGSTPPSDAIQGLVNRAAPEYVELRDECARLKQEAIIAAHSAAESAIAANTLSLEFAKQAESIVRTQRLFVSHFAFA